MKKKSIFILIFFISVSIIVLKHYLSTPENKSVDLNSSTIIYNDNLIEPTRFVFLDATKIDKKDNPLKISSEDQSKLSVNIIDSQDINTIQNFYTNKPLMLLSEVEFRKIYDQFDRNEDHELMYTIHAMYNYDLHMELAESHYVFSDGYIKKSGEFYQVFTKGVGLNAKNYFVKGTLDENEIQYINQAYVESYSLNYSE